MTGIPLAAVDTAWLHMEDPTNLMMVTGIALMPGTIDIDRLRRTLEARLVPIDRFHMRVSESRLPVGLPRWERDPHFDLDAHIHHMALPAPGDMRTLQRFAGDLASTSFERVTPEDSLATALQKLAVRGRHYIPVVDAVESDRLVGVIGRQEILAAYDRELLRARD